MRKVLKAGCSEGKVYVEVFCLDSKIPDGAHVRAMVVTELTPLPLCAKDIPRLHAHGRYRDIRGKVIAFEPTDFDGRLLCLMWEHKVDQWTCNWYILLCPADNYYLADELLDLSSLSASQVKTYVVFEPRKR